LPIVDDGFLLGDAYARRVQRIAASLACGKPETMPTGNAGDRTPPIELIDGLCW
jgi:hypothetical protein